jgi:hypothetical protein
MDNRREGHGRPTEEPEWGMGTRRETNSLVRLFGQMMMLPLTVFVYGMDIFVKTVQGMQRTADEGMDVMLGDASRPQRETAGTPRNPQGEPGNQRETESDLATTSTSCAVEDDAQTNPKETRDMSDTDLSGENILKLVRYKILFIKRDYEHAFQEVEELVSDNTDETGYTAWKIAEFIQRLAKRETRVPGSWKSYPVNEPPPTLPYRDGDILLGLPEKDKKFLRVYYEVLHRYDRESFRYEERQIEVLEEIRDRL